MTQILIFKKIKYYICPRKNTVVVVQLVRTSDCGSEGRGFKSHHPPNKKASDFSGAFFMPLNIVICFRWLSRFNRDHPPKYRNRFNFERFFSDFSTTLFYVDKNQYTKDLNFYCLSESRFLSILKNYLTFFKINRK